MNYQSVRWYALDEKRLTKASDGIRDAWGLIKTQIKVFDSSKVPPDRYQVETFALSLSAELGWLLAADGNSTSPTMLASLRATLLVIEDTESCHEHI